MKIVTTSALAKEFILSRACQWALGIVSVLREVGVILRIIRCHSLKPPRFEPFIIHIVCIQAVH